MYIALMGCAQQGSAAPLAASVDGASLSDTVNEVGPATGSVVTFTTTSGALSATVVATGGSGSYTYSWSVLAKTLDDSDTGNRFSINTTGTTTNATYNTLTIDGARPASAGLPFVGEFLIRCAVNDGSSTVNVDLPFTILGESF